MAQDPYTVLGVSRKASDDDIRKAFRKLAKELHPDVNKDSPQSAERFKKVSQAYDILGDAEKRRMFDRGEIGADGEPRPTYQRAGAGAAGGRAGGPFGGANGGGRPRSPVDDMGFGDIFSDLFAGGGPGAGAAGYPGAGARGRPSGRAAGAGFAAKGRDVTYTLEITLLEALHGARKRVTLPNGGKLDLTVPAGVDDGKTLRLRGKGHPGLGGAEAGDALVEITVQPHPTFSRDGSTIRSTVPISIDEAVLGGKVPVETAQGTVQLTVPKGTSSGTTLRLRGKGAPTGKNDQFGDHLVTVQIELPKKIDESLSYFMTEWRGSHGYDPRKN